MVVLLSFVIVSTTTMYVLDATIDSPWDVEYDEEYFGPRCEHVRPDKFLRERANAMSNLVFCAVGVYMILAGIHDFRNGIHNCLPESFGGFYGSLRSRCEWSLVLGLACAFAGFGSFYFHASHGDRMGGKTDIASIYILVFACVCSITFNTVSIIKAAYFSSSLKSERFISYAFVLVWLGALVPLWYWKKLLFFGGWKTMKISLIIIIGCLITLAFCGSIVANKKTECENT